MNKARIKAGKKVLCILLIIILAGAAAFLLYCLPYYHAKNAPDFSEDERVSIEDKGKYIFYDGPGTDTALIFYPGAKVDEKAYEALMVGIAEEGTDCFLVKMPLHRAFFGKSRADIIMKSYDYDAWLMGGHSLGGSMAAEYTKSHGDAVDGLVFLASFSASDLTRYQNLRCLSVYGSRDLVLNRSKYEQNKANLPAGSLSEVVIDGGNHAGFAYYGPQKGDGEAAISKEEQIKKTVDAVAEWGQ